MDILCQQRPKPSLPFGGNYSIIDFTLSNCVHSQVKSIEVLVDYQRSSMTEYLRQWESANPEAPGISILPPGSGSYCGTADAVYQNLRHPELKSSETVLVLAGDHVYNMDYRKMLEFHHASRADLTVAVVRVPMAETSRFGTAVAGPDGRILAFVEKSANSTSNLASMGIYIFNRRYLEEILKEDAGNHNSTHDFGYAILPRSVKTDRVFAYEFNGYWRDIGTVDSYYEANLNLLDSRSDFTVDHLQEVLTARARSGYSLQNQPGIVNSLISPGCIIEGSVENSILSPGVWVGKKARVINSVVMANTHIGYHSLVDRSILDEDVNIEEFCYVGFGSTPISRNSDVTLVGKDVDLGPQTAIGKKSRILPGMKLVDLSSRFVAPGTVVSVPT